MMTSQIAKSKTSVQISTIFFTLTIVSLKGISWTIVMDYLTFVKEYELVYYFTMVAVLFTLYTGFTYIQENRKAIKEMMN